MRHVEEDGVHKDSASRLVTGLINIRAIVNHFTPKIDSWSASHQVASLTPDQVTVLLGYIGTTITIHDPKDT